jgi:RNA polymerase sigma factor (sigma-70 family)
MPSASLTPIQRCLNRLKSGDVAAKEELFRAGMERLRLCTSRMLRHFPGVRRWEDTDDVLQNALIRLNRSMAEVPLDSTLDFLYFAAAQIRRELIDLARRHSAQKSQGANHATPHHRHAKGIIESQPDRHAADEPARLQRWSEFHDRIAALPSEEREVFDLFWYHGMSQDEAAALLEVSTRTVKRRWRSARLRLHEAMGDELPE